MKYLYGATVEETVIVDGDENVGKVVGVCFLNWLLYVSTPRPLQYISF